MSVVLMKQLKKQKANKGTIVDIINTVAKIIAEKISSLYVC